MTELFSLGKLYPSDFLKPNEQPRCEPVELKLVMEEGGLVRLEKVAPKEALWGKYWYRSSISDTMKEQLRDVVGSILKLIEVKEGAVWLDIAGNDGYLLSLTPIEFYAVNIDPADSTFAIESKEHCEVVIQDYFSAAAYFSKVTAKASVITIISMFYDLENPGEFLDDVYKVMADDALLVIQMSYTPLMLDQLEFSNLCHEHIYYYSLFNIMPLLEKHGFRVMDVELNNTNAGSFRLYIIKQTADVTKYASQTHRDVCGYRIHSLLCYENFILLDSVSRWRAFFEKINNLKSIVVEFIEKQVGIGKTIMGYGASTKFNTVLQYFGLNSQLITAIADRSPAKYGLRCVGSNIPIISEHEMRHLHPDYLLIGPAHFISEFKEREAEYLSKGGKFICIMPSFQIIEK